MAATAQHEAPAAQQSAKALASAAVARHAACVIEPAAQTACQPPGEAAAAVPAAAAAAKPTASPSRAHRSTTSHGAPCGREAPTAAGKCGAANAGSAPGAAADGPGTAAGEFGGEAGGSKVKPQMPGAAEEALRQLDMAALLGGPLFRPLLDACIAALQTDIDSAAVAAAAVHPAGESSYWQCVLRCIMCIAALQTSIDSAAAAAAALAASKRGDLDAGNVCLPPLHAPAL